MASRTVVFATCHEAAEDVAILEIERFGFSAARLAPGLIRAEGSNVFEILGAACCSGRIMFVRHLVPLDCSFPVLDSIEETVTRLAREIPLGGHRAFSAHVRTIGTGEPPVGRAELAMGIEVYAARLGSEVRRKSPEIICSVIIDGDLLYAGLASSRAMLSTWSGGEVRYRNEPEQISRAEFKLLEAIEVFWLPASAGAKVLDLGASPGGWSRILASRGAEVTAVDPAPLDPRISDISEISYVQMTAQEFARIHHSSQFDLIVNDMKMDARESASLMVDLSEHLRGTHALLTLKLPHDSAARTLETVAESLDILRQKYDVVGARQLFHNRSELTVYLKRL